MLRLLLGAECDIQWPSKIPFLYGMHTAETNRQEISDFSSEGWSFALFFVQFAVRTAAATAELLSQ